MLQSTGQYVELYKILGYEFKDDSLIREALTHPSLEGGRSYQRLEFVGDRVLGLVIADWLYEIYPDMDEGGLASRHTNLVRRETCAKVALEMDLGPFIHMDKSTEDMGGRTRETILADVCESILGAIYREAGHDVALELVRRFWKDRINHENVAVRDAKTLLQEWVQARGRPTPTYVTLDRRGPAHEPIFTIAVRVNGSGEETAEGKAKREAEQIAAAKMLTRLENG